MREKEKRDKYDTQVMAWDKFAKQAHIEQSGTEIKCNLTCMRRLYCDDMRLCLQIVFFLLLLFPSSKFSFWPYMRSQPRLYVFKYAVKYGEREKKNAETDVCALFVHMEIT